MTLPTDLSPLYVSLATTCAATIATFFLGMIAARLMYATSGSLRAWIDGILTLPLVLPPTVVGFFLLLAFGRRSPLGLALEHLGFMVVFSWPATVIAATVVAFPLMYRTTLAGFEQVNPTLLDAARTLGASEWTVFRKVLLPLATPGVIAGTVLAFARALGEFGATLMFAGNIPGRTQTMPIAIFSSAEDGNMKLALFWVCLIVVISLAIIRLLNLKGPEERHLQNFKGQTSDSPCQTPVTVVRSADLRPGPNSLEIDIHKRLEGFSLDVKLLTGTGAMGVLGVSGAGKSMTLRMIAGVLAPDRGRIVLGSEIFYDSESGANVLAAQRRIGVVFQDYALFPHLTIAENVGFGLHTAQAQTRRSRVDELLKLLRISDLALRYPGEISGGQKQRAAIARCLAIDPNALLLDEPFAALDPHLRRQTEEQLREILAGYSGPVLFVTHDMEEAFRFCTDLAVLDHGTVLVSGSRNELFERPQTVVVARLTGCKNIVAARPVSETAVNIDSWGCELVSTAQMPARLTHIGIRSHQILFQQERSIENTFPCWLLSLSEAPHEMTLYLKLHGPPRQGDHPHLQADLPKETWRTLSAQPQPWKITFDPSRVLLLEG